MADLNELAAAEAEAPEDDLRPLDRVIGRASATERQANTADQFSFWLRPGEQVNPFDIVAAEHLDRTVSYGLVTGIQHSTDAPTHLTNFIANDFGELVDEPNTPRQGANVCDVSVMSNTGEIYMPVQTEALVRFADEEGIHHGLGIEIMADKERDQARPVRVPSGLIQMSNGISAVAHLDIDYVVGPEAAHVNVGGISGLATKTSYVMFLLQSLLQVLERAAHAEGAPSDVAVILVNVKHNDLLQIHEEPRSYSDEDLEMWRAMGLQAQPFRNVEYLLPAGRTTQQVPDRPNSYEPYPPVGLFKIYAYGLRDAYTRLPNLLADVPDEYGVLDAIMGEIIDGLDRNRGGWGNVRTVYEVMSAGTEEGVDFEGLEEGQVGRPPRRVILFVDELNKFAPTAGRDSPLLHDLIEIAERGRSLGVVLLSVQQFASAVHSRVIGNSATRVFGRTAPTELPQAAYRGLNENVRGHLVRLSKGELILTHPLYRQPVKIRFPRPAYRQPGT